MPQGYNPSFRVMPLGHKLGRKTIMTRLMPLGHKVSVYGTFCPIEEKMHKMKRQYRTCYEDNDEDDDKSSKIC
jgi:hypothetical protein